MLDGGYDIAAYGPSRRATARCAISGPWCAPARRGIRVITELVINHTSDQHPLVSEGAGGQAGQRRSATFMSGGTTTSAIEDARIIFVDSEKSNWTWDPVAKAYYWHRFYSHQPDLNFDNPRVLRGRHQRRCASGSIPAWTGCDSTPFPIWSSATGTNCENLPETHDVIRKIRAEIETHYPDRMLIAEANQWPEDVAAYFGNGDECHMCFHFPLMPRMYMAIAQEDRHPDHGYHAPDAGDSRQLPMGDIPAQP